MKFNLFEEAEIEEQILNANVMDFNKFYEDLESNKFEDNEFPPETRSLTTDVKAFPKATDIIWKKAADIFE